MSRPSSFVYSETTMAPWWMIALVWFVCLIPLMSVTEGILGPTTFASVLAAILFHLLFGKFTVGVSETEGAVVAAFGVGWIHKRIELDSIVGVTTTQYRPILEFGGWGIRGFGRKKAWTIRGNQAVVLEFDCGRRLYLGSQTPLRLRERIESAMARQRNS
jgi:hypothetical protein